MITNIYLFGVIGERYGRHWILDVHSPHEIGPAIDRLRPGFAKFILDMKEVDFGVTVGGKQIGEDRIDFPNRGRVVTITPVVRGSADAKSWIQVVAGVVLIAAAVVFSSYLGPFALQLGLLGASLALGGIAGLLAPSPSTPDSGDDKKHKASYLMSGTVNTIEQGQCVPVFYGGPGFIGSAVISGGVEASDITIGAKKVGTSSKSDNPARAGHGSQPISSSSQDEY